MTELELRKLIEPNTSQIFLFSSPCILPIFFARHPWFVLSVAGKLTRFEAGFSKDLITDVNSPYVRKDSWPAHVGIRMLPGKWKLNWGSRLEGVISSKNIPEIDKIIEFIKVSGTNYPYRTKYHFWGPNSNTYAQWVLKAFPGIFPPLPAGSFGKNFKKANKTK